MKRRHVAIVFLLAAAGALCFFYLVPGQVEAGINTTLDRLPHHASERARALHERLLIADLHADTLLWDRDLLTRNTYGHVDVPRLIEGHVGLQAFTIVTKAPKNIKQEGNDSSTDSITLLAVAQRWPIAAWTSMKARALHQAARLTDAAARSNGRLVVLRTSGDLGNYLQRRRRDPVMTSGLLGIEGAHALDGNLDNIDELFDAGVRMMSPTHLADNDMGGSAQGTERGGLSDRGKELIRRVESKHMVLDLAHASPPAFADAIAVATRPLVVSHTGVFGTCANARNLSDDQLRAVATNGGVVGIGYWETATCGTDADAVARAIRHAVGVMGIDHVGLGSDFDGAVAQPFDATGLVEITEALIASGFSDAEIAAVMGGNVIRLLLATLP